MQFEFDASVVVSATSEEDALNKIGGRIGAISRHLGDGSALAETAAFFTLTETQDAETANAFVDPLAPSSSAPGADDTTSIQGTN